MRVLIIGDDARMVTRLRRRLWRDGHVVAVAPDGASGLPQAETGAYDAVILDTAGTGVDGLAVTQRMRAASVTTPILILAAQASVAERLRGLDAGADDVLTEPFTFEELAARLRAITRRGPQPLQEDDLAAGDLILNRRTRIVTRGGRRLDLAPREFALLEYLMRHPGQVVTRAALLEHVWDYGFEPRANVVDAAIKRLRKAVDAGEPHPMIRTVRGIGYALQNET